MKRALRILAVVILVSALALWLAKGAHRGWTINNLEHDTLNPVTGLTGVTFEKVFIPGFDFLIAAALASVALMCTSFFVSKKNPVTKLPAAESYTLTKKA